MSTGSRTYTEISWANQTLVWRRAGHRPAWVGVTGVDRPVDPRTAGQVIGDDDACRGSASSVSKCDRKPNLRANSHACSIGRFGNAQDSTCERHSLVSADVRAARVTRIIIKIICYSAQGTSRCRGYGGARADGRAAVLNMQINSGGVPSRIYE